MSIKGSFNLKKLGNELVLWLVQEMLEHTAEHIFNLITHL
jgi:hypothetical protein